MVDLVIMRREFLNGNLDGLKQIYRLYKGDVINVVNSKRFASNVDAEEYFSQSLLVFYEKLMEDKNNEILSVKNYLIGICLNKLRTDICTNSKFKQKASEVRDLLYQYQDDKSRLNYREELKIICRESLQQLDQRCNKIICSFYLDKMSMREIAKGLGLSSSDVAKTLKSRCFKKLIKLTKKIKNERIICR